MSMYTKIVDDLMARMSSHVNSMCATDDEVSMAWLISEIDELKKLLERTKPYIAGDVDLGEVDK